MKRFFGTAVDSSASAFASLLRRGLFFLGVLCACRIGVAQDVLILTNHLGYDPGVSKRAVIRGHAGDEVTAFKVIDAHNGAVLFSGPTPEAGAVDQWKDWLFWTADFSPLRKEGSYILECETKAGPVRSYPFAIQQNILERDTLSDVVYYFKDQRTVGQRNKADHHLKFEDSTDPTKTLDLHGGWADATGDAGKHLSHLSFATYFNPQHGPLTTWALFKSYDTLRNRKDRNFRQIELRMLDEAMYGADYLCRSKNPKGSFYRSVDDPGGRPEDRYVAKDFSGGLIGKRKNTNPLQKGDMSRISADFLYEIGFRSGGGMAIAALAAASTYPVCGDYTNAQYLKAAEDGFAFLEKYNLYYTNDGKENIIDDYCILMAATELYRATHEEHYKAVADERARNLMGRLATSGTYVNYWRADDGDRPFFHAADAGLPVVALLNYADIADAPARKAVLETARKSMAFEMRTTGEVTNPFGYARQFVQSKDGERRTTFFYPHDADTAPWWQGENARLASLACAARMTADQFTDDAAFHDALEAYAADQLNWILGENPYDCCMLKGSGRNNSSYIYNGSYEYIGAPGGICNGITAGFTNPHDIDFSLPESISKNDEGWRWNEQWLPHSTWYMLAVSQGSK